jgi:hypothetical protein
MDLRAAGNVAANSGATPERRGDDLSAAKDPSRNATVTGRRHPSRENGFGEVC